MAAVREFVKYSPKVGLVQLDPNNHINSLVVLVIIFNMLRIYTF